MKRSTVVAMVAVLVLWAAAGCEDDEHFPPGEGGGPSGGGGSGQNDAGGGGADAGGADAGPTLTGELCDVGDDVRRPLVCPTGVDLSQIEVRAADPQANDLTDGNGDFSLSGTFDGSELLSVGREQDNTRLALVRVSDWDLGALRIPRVDQDDWDQLIQDAIGTNEQTGTASIALYVVNLDGIPVPDIVVDVSDAGGALVYYDGGSPDEWIMLGDTGPLGAALILQVPVADGEVVLMVGTDPFEIPVAEDHLTWARVEV